MSLEETDSISISRREFNTALIFPKHESVGFTLPVQIRKRRATGLQTAEALCFVSYLCPAIKKDGAHKT